MASPVFTNSVIKKMASLGLSESQVTDVFNKGDVEKWKDYNVSIKKYSGYELRVFWKRDPQGRYVIISVNKRARR